MPALVCLAFSSAKHCWIAVKSSEKVLDAGASRKSISELRRAGSKEVGMPSEYVLIEALDG